MVGSKESNSLHVLDKRIIDRNIEKELLSKKEYEAYLKSLKDESGACEPLALKDDK
jgi:deoxyadenosine/deoxycytidine kinase